MSLYTRCFTACLLWVGVSQTTFSTVSPVNAAEPFRLPRTAHKNVTDDVMKLVGEANCLYILPTAYGPDRKAVASHAEVLELYLSSPKITDTALVHLKKLPNLHTLYLGHTSVTDAGLAELKTLTNLQSLWLTDTAISDEGLVHLKALPKLQYLLMDGTRVTNAGLVHLKPLVNLQQATFKQTQVTDFSSIKKALPNCFFANE